MPHANQAFPQFYTNDVIRELAKSPRWTVSDIDKMPIDMRELKQNDRIRGAYEKSESCLMRLDELVEFLPNAANHTYALNVHIDHYLVLDIEPKCPPEVARDLLAMPSVYSELSMSGKGYHLLMPLPAAFADYPIAATKVFLREEHGWYEILLDHWVTFTRKPVPADHLGDVAAPSRSWDQLYSDMAETAALVQSDADTRNAVSVDKPEIPGESDAIYVMTSQGLPKSLSDFNDDNSRFEFSVLGTLFQRLSPALPYLEQEHDITYTASMKAWLLYEGAVRLLPHRAKHDQTRNQLPLLLNAATDLLARREAQRLADA